MTISFRKATQEEIPQIWKILEKAILRRKEEGSSQWQDGYPNKEVIQQDIEKGAGYVLIVGETVAGYTAVLKNEEPAYESIKGNWLTNGDFMVFHRVAVSENYLGRGMAKKMLDFIEELAREQKIFSIKADTNFDNPAMLKTFEKAGYTYCGEVYLRGGERKAFEKVLSFPEMDY